MTMPPIGPGSQRTVPAVLRPQQVQRLHDLLHQSELWVLRGHWHRFLWDGDTSTFVPIASLSRDHRVAASAWLRQQRHYLYRALSGGESAPQGWLESLPLYRALAY